MGRTNADHPIQALKYRVRRSYMKEGSKLNDMEKEQSVNASRRSFFKTTLQAGGGVLAGVLAGDLAAQASPEAESGKLPAAQYELHFDTTKCAGCAYCEVACAQFHAGDADIKARRNVFDLKPVLPFIGASALSANAPGIPQHLSWANFTEMSTNEFCRQCPSPECLDACPEKAIFIDPKTGARVVNEAKCVGCGTCVEACQFGMIHVHPEAETAFKCDFCGGNPQCVAWCPTGAITYTKL
ncbi:MAG: hypothetical protein CVU60_09590 [Deltaproteobacteria bacterium HGW-Deltaproteobacteria-18]|nr:MAG: hypothetical protein CVU60_09590 [Deltaproteobacteria bacterium HGW-Deltaproteobacteria-18]